VILSSGSVDEDEQYIPTVETYLARKLGIYR